jgi:hypothetical protein
MYFIGKFNVTDKNIFQKNIFKIAQIAIVKGIYDEYGFGRIQVDIPATPSVGGTGVKLDAKGNRIWTTAIPLLPKHLSVIPKVDESVLVFTFEGAMTQDVYYIGPIISSLDKLRKDDGSISARRMFSYGVGKIDPPVTSIKTNNNIIPSLKGVFADPEDITIQGRYNTDIIQKENEILIRAGKFVSSKKGENNNPYDFKFNLATQGFIQIKNNFNFSKDKKITTLGTVTNIVSNKINLLTYGGSPNVILNQDDLLSKDQINNLMSDDRNIAAHPIPFGDILLDMLKLLKSGIVSHVHSTHGKKAEDIQAEGNQVGVMETFEQEFGKLEKILLSKNIRIN